MYFEMTSMPNGDSSWYTKTTTLRLKIYTCVWLAPIKIPVSFGNLYFNFSCVDY